MGEKWTIKVLLIELRNQTVSIGLVLQHIWNYLNENIFIHWILVSSGGMYSIRKSQTIDIDIDRHKKKENLTIPITELLSVEMKRGRLIYIKLSLLLYIHEFLHQATFQFKLSNISHNSTTTHLSTLLEKKIIITLLQINLEQGKIIM